MNMYDQVAIKILSDYHIPGIHDQTAECLLYKSSHLLIHTLAPNPFLPPVVFFWSSSKFDPVSRFPKMSSGTYTWCSLCIWMGMPCPSFHTEIDPSSASTVTCACHITARSARKRQFWATSVTPFGAPTLILVQ